MCNCKTLAMVSKVRDLKAAETKCSRTIVRRLYSTNYTVSTEGTSTDTIQNISERKVTTRPAGIYH